MARDSGIVRKLTGDAFIRSLPSFRQLHWDVKPGEMIDSDDSHGDDSHADDDSHGDSCAGSNGNIDVGSGDDGWVDDDDGDGVYGN